MTKRRKLSALDRLDGNPSRRLMQVGGVEGLGEPFIPEHLCDDARGCVEIIQQSMPVRVYSALDSFLLAAFAMAWAVHKRAALKISDPEFEHVVATDKGNLYSNPWLNILNRQAVLLASLGDRLGLDPKSRAQLAVPGMRTVESPFDGLLGSQSVATLNAPNESSDSSKN